jgi:ABC-type antimicrobial peptide transport system permease subunit
MAISAPPGGLFRTVLWDAMLLIAAGAVIGIIASLAAARVLTTLLFGVKPVDPATFIVTALVLIAVGVLAAWFPARRAVKVDPLIALRYE